MALPWKAYGYITDICEGLIDGKWATFIISRIEVKNRIQSSIEKDSDAVRSSG